MALPSPSCFTAGERIPFVLSLSFPDEPAVPSILVRDVRIELIKRTRLSRLGGLEVAMREVSVGRADIQNIKESGDGVTHLSGVILAGKDGREYSWKIYTLADVQVSLKPVEPRRNTDEYHCSTSSERSLAHQNLCREIWPAGEAT